MWVLPFMSLYTHYQCPLIQYTKTACIHVPIKENIYEAINIQR